MSDQATPQNEAAETAFDGTARRAAPHEPADPVAARLSATEVPFPWVWALVGLMVVVVSVVIALVTESRGIGLQ